MSSDKVISDERFVKLASLADKCDEAGPTDRHFVFMAAGELVGLGLLSDEDTKQFQRYYNECAMVDCAKLLTPPGWKTNLHQDYEGRWCASLSEDDPISGWFKAETICRAKAITEHHARTAAALRAWGEVTV